MKRNRFGRIVVTSFLVLVLAISGGFTASFVKWGRDHVSFASSGSDFVAAHGDLVVHFIDMGQADAIVVQFPSGEVMMVDSGVSMPAADSAHVTAERNKLRDYLNTYIFNGHTGSGKPVIDWFVLTHSDFDHVGGVPMLYADYDINTIFRPAIFTTSERALLDSSKTIAGTYGIGCAELYGKNFGAGPWTTVTGSNYNNFVTGAYTGGRDVIFHEDVGDFYVGDVEVTFHAPEKYHYGGADSSAHNINSQCPLIVLDYEDKRIMLAADATEEQDEEWLERYKDAPALDTQMDILKVQHHGSLDGNSTAFLESVLYPKSYAIISVGDKSIEGSYSQQYDHPKQTVLDRLGAILDSEDQIYLTFQVGDVLGVISIGGLVDIILDHQGKPYNGKPKTNIVPFIIVGVTVVAGIVIICFFIIDRRRHKRHQKLKHTTHPHGIK